MKGFKPLLKIATSIGLLYYFFVTKQEINLLSFSLSHLLLVMSGVLLFSVVTVIMTVRWRGTLEFAKVEELGSFWQCYQAYCFAQFIGLFTIGYLGTDGGRLYYGQKRGAQLVTMTKELFKERLLSLGSLVFLTVLFFISPYTVIFPLFAILLDKSMTYKKSFFIAYGGHLLKVFFLIMVAGVVLNWELAVDGARNLSLALFLESLPISWQGLGVGQVSFDRFVAEGGAQVYQVYFEAKVLFKLLSGLFYFNRPIKKGP